MNICAVRTIAGASSGELKDKPLPHEPEMFDEEMFLIPIQPSVSDIRARVCKHCGSVYFEDKK